MTHSSQNDTHQEKTELSTDLLTPNLKDFEMQHILYNLLAVSELALVAMVTKLSRLIKEFPHYTIHIVM